MQTPSLSRAAEKIHTLFSLYHLFLLRASRVVKLKPEIVSAFETAHETFGALITARAKAEKNLVELTATRNWAQKRMERGLRDFAYDVLGRVEDDRTAPLYRAYFPNGYGRLARGSLDDLIAMSEQILAQLAQVPDEQLDPAGQVLSTVLEEAKVDRASYEEAKAAYRAAKQAVEVGKRPWREAYRASFYALSIFHSDDPRKAEDYFRQYRPRVGQSEDELDEAPVNGGGVEGTKDPEAEADAGILAGASVNGDNGSEPPDAEKFATGSAKGA